MLYDEEHGEYCRYHNGVGHGDVSAVGEDQARPLYSLGMFLTLIWLYPTSLVSFTRRKYRCPAERKDRCLQSRKHVCEFRVHASFGFRNMLLIPGPNLCYFFSQYSLLTGLHPLHDFCDEVHVGEHVADGRRPFIDERWLEESFAEAELVRIIRNCWRQHPENRPSAGELVLTLRESVKMNRQLIAQQQLEDNVVSNSDQEAITI